MGNAMRGTSGLKALAFIPARGGSKGVHHKNLLPIAGKPCIAYSIEAARESEYVNRIVVSTDSPAIASVARQFGAEVIDRPAELATAESRVDYAVRHGLAWLQEKEGYEPDVVVFLAANVPVREPSIADRCVRHLLTSGSDSVATYSRVGKYHPQWMNRIEGDRVISYQPMKAYRRQDLPELYIHDGSCIAIRADVIVASAAHTDDNLAWRGSDRRGLISTDGSTVEIDGVLDVHMAEGLLTKQKVTPIRISDRQVGPGLGRVYVIAEAGVNHNGDLSRAHAMIDAAAEAGADAVKFQAFKADAMVTRDASKAEYQKRTTGEGGSQHEMLRALELSREALVELREHARRKNIHFIVSPFDLASLTEVLKIGLDAIKIASPELVDIPLLTAAARSGLPCILSRGAATLPEVERAVELVRRSGKGALALLHCVSAYPAPLETLNLSVIKVLEQTFLLPVGFSDHTYSTVPVEMLAVQAGACILEKHFTLDRNLPGPDHAMSLEPTELAAYVRNAKQVLPAILGAGDIVPAEIELELRRTSRKSLVAAADIRKGEVITREMLTLKRPGTGLSPERTDEVVGKVATRDIGQDTILSTDMFGPA